MPQCPTRTGSIRQCRHEVEPVIRRSPARVRRKVLFTESLAVVVDVEFNTPIVVVHTHRDVGGSGLTAREREPFLEQDSAGRAHRCTEATSRRGDIK